MRTAWIAAVVVVFGLAASVALAAPLTPGTWLFQGNYGGKPRSGDARLMRVYVEFEEGARAMILGIEGATRAKCSKFPGRPTVSYAVKKPRVAIRGNSRFASKWMKLVSSSGIRGKVKLTGTIDSERVRGTLRLRMTIKGLGSCSTKERFRVKTQAH